VFGIEGAPTGLTADPLTLQPNEPAGDLVVHVLPDVVADQAITVTVTSGSHKQTVPVWGTAGFNAGTPDATFGTSGYSVVPGVGVSMGPASPAAIGRLVLQPDGSILLPLEDLVHNGSFPSPGRLVRFTSDGRLDPGFGVGGTV